MRTILIMMIMIAPFWTAAAESRLSSLHDDWRACATDSDCAVIHLNGCPWDSIPVARRFSEKVYEWAKRENMRHNCVREAVSADVKRRMRAVCENAVCAFGSLATDTQ